MARRRAAGKSMGDRAAWKAIAMKPIGPASRHLQGLSRRELLWTGSTGLATGLLSAGLIELAIKQSWGAGESGMDMQGHAAHQ